KGVRILIVDDNATNRTLLHEMISRRGACAAEAADGPRALELFQTARIEGNPFNLVLLDGRMPDMDGFEVAREIRRLDAGGHTAVLMLSSDNLGLDEIQARHFGLDAYLLKPVRRSVLFHAIAKAMGIHEASVAGEPETPVADAPSLESDVRVLVADDSPDN